MSKTNTPLPEQTPADVAYRLEKDLELCNRATPPPWRVGHNLPSRARNLKEDIHVYTEHLEDGKPSNDIICCYEHTEFSERVRNKQVMEGLREKDPIGHRMKTYELAEAGRKATPLLPLLARLDGKCFSAWTRGLARPYDERLSNIMVDLTRAMATQQHYSHKELLNKHSGQMQEMLWQKGVNWNEYPRFFKRGTYVQRKLVSRKFTVAELELLPLKHAARQNPDLEVERSEYRSLDMPVFSTVTNRVGVLFRGEDPITNVTKGVAHAT